MNGAMWHKKKPQQLTCRHGSMSLSGNHLNTRWHLWMIYDAEIKTVQAEDWWDSWLFFTLDRTSNLHGFPGLFCPLLEKTELQYTSLLCFLCCDLILQWYIWKHSHLRSSNTFLRVPSMSSKCCEGISKDPRSLKRLKHLAIGSPWENKLCITTLTEAVF